MSGTSAISLIRSVWKPFDATRSRSPHPAGVDTAQRRLADTLATRLAGVTGDAAVGEEVGRVGEDHVETAVGCPEILRGKFRGDGVEHCAHSTSRARLVRLGFEAVALVEEDAMGGRRGRRS
jgi:hypothetical protein